MTNVCRKIIKTKFIFNFLIYILFDVLLAIKIRFTTLDFMLKIRIATPADLDHLWELFNGIIEEKIYYPYTPGTPRSQLEKTWINAANISYIALYDGQVAGAYILRPNQEGYGNHIANGAYMVSPSYRNLGIGKNLALHSLVVAREAGYKGMQYNLVVSTNKAAVKLWQDIGFEIIATVPGGFKHYIKGYVDAYIMFQKLV
jgi:ribosomal protein S18 acetylase RimI-like enzyme